MRLSGLIVLLLVSETLVQDDDYSDYYDYESTVAKEVQDDDYYDYYDYESTVDSNASTDCKTVG